MPTFEDWRKVYQDNVERYTGYYKAGGASSKRAREKALIEANIVTKRSQNEMGELPPPFEVGAPE